MAMFQSFTKVSAMMVGEVEANDILGRRAWVANALLILFEIITVIILINLMVGIILPLFLIPMALPLGITSSPQHYPKGIPHLQGITPGDCPIPQEEGGGLGSNPSPAQNFCAHLKIFYRYFGPETHIGVFRVLNTILVLVLTFLGFF